MSRQIVYGVKLTGDAKGAVNASRLTRDELQRLDRQMGRTQREARETDAAFQRWAKSMGGLRGALGGVGAALSGGAFLAGASRALTQLQALDRTALALGTSVETVQELTYTFAQFGLQSDDVSDALNTLADRSQDAIDGAKSMVEDFALLGIAVSDLRGKEPDELFALMAERVAQIEDPTARAAAVVRIFGDDLGRLLLPLLIQGAEGYRKFREEAHEVNYVLSEEQVKAAAAAARELNKVKAVFDAQFNRAIAENADEFTELSEILTSEGFQSAADTFVGIFSAMATEAGEAARQIGNLVNLLKGEGSLGALLEGSAIGLARRTLDQFGLESRPFGAADPSQALTPSAMGLVSDIPREPRVPSSVSALEPITVTAQRPDVSLPPIPGAIGINDLAPGDLFGDVVAREQLARDMGMLDAAQDARETREEMARLGLTVDETSGMLIDLGAAYGRSAEEMERLQRQASGLDAAFSVSAQTAADFGFTLSSSFERAVLAGEDLRGVIAGLAQDLAQLTFRKSVTDPLAGALSSWIDGISFGGGGGQALTTDFMGLTSPVPGPIAMSADGNVFSAPSITSIAERGQPEAVFPLVRMGGRLGIQASGGGAPAINLSISNPITINGNVDSDARVREVQAAAELGAQRGADRILQQLRRGGPARALTRG
jgi:hypothetical protein